MEPPSRHLLHLLTAAALAASASAQCLPIESLDRAYLQDFDTLAAAGSSGQTPPGWLFLESGVNADAAYSAGDGSNNSGDTYSYGAPGSSDRALGTLRSGSLVSTVGACFVNRTGRPITRFAIAYTGRQFRLGGLNRRDSLDFQYRVDASSLDQPGAWTASPDLSFTAPLQGPATGAVSARSERSASLSAAVPYGSTLWIRWLDFDATGADDGLAIDDFTLTPSAPVGLSISGLTLEEGDAGSTIASVAATLDTPSARPVSFDIAVTGGTATSGVDYTPCAAARLTIPSGQTRVNFDITVLGDRDFEPDETILVEASNIEGALLVQPRATIVITGDDPGRIGQIQGAGPESPYPGRVVLTEGVVTARKSNGLFLQSAPGGDDADPATSDGIFVFTGTAFDFESAPTGTLLRLRGTVTEFRPAADPSSPPLTELTQPVIAARLGAVPLPPPVPIEGAPEERLEAMRVRVDSLLVTGPAGGSILERDATATSNGVFLGVASGARPYREPGLDANDPLPDSAACCIPRWDANPEILRVAGGIDPAAGAVLTDLTGVLDFGFRAYTLIPDPGAPLASPPLPAAAPLPEPEPGQFTVASFNLERFFDTADDPGVGDIVLTPAAFERRLRKVSLAIRDILRSPDIIGVQEAENIAALQAIADRVNADSAGVNPRYSAHLVEGNDPGGIDVGFLVKTARVRVEGVTQEGSNATYIDPRTGRPEILNDRPPLVLRASVDGLGVTALVNHLRSLTNLADPEDGPRIRAKRQAQADYLAALVQARQSADPSEHIVVLGDFNAFPFSDGHADVVNTIRGTQGPAAHVAAWSPAAVDPALVDAAESAPAARRYSYVFGGSIQTLDQLLFTANLRSRFVSLRYAHFNADFPEILRNDPSRPERISDHDVPVAAFHLTPPPLAVGLTAFSQPIADRVIAYEISVWNGSAQPLAGLPVVFTPPASGRISNVFLPPGWTCTSEADCTATLPPGAVGRAYVWVSIDPSTRNGQPVEAAASAGGVSAVHSTFAAAP